MEKNMEIIISVLRPLVKNGIISQADLERIKNIKSGKCLPEKQVETFKTIKETCQLLHVRRQTIHSWMKSGKLEYTRLSRKKVLIYESSITRLTEEQRNIPACH